MIRIKESISRRTRYSDAIQLLQKYGFKEVYHHDFIDPYTEETNNHFHIFSKYSIAIIIESSGQSLVTCETYVSFNNAARDLAHEHSRQIFDVHVFDFIYDIFTTIQNWNYDKLMAESWEHNGEDILRVMDYVETRPEGKYSMMAALDGTKEAEMRRRFSTMPENFLRAINYSGITEKV